jgi:endogenous inhibitor of DNA gyrase (YacG/DUF329 family)
MKCPICGKTVHWVDNPSRPFCSERCQLIDFGRWANEEYCVPAESPSNDEPPSGVRESPDELQEDLQGPPQW